MKNNINIVGAVHLPFLREWSLHFKIVLRSETFFFVSKCPARVNGRSIFNKWMVDFRKKPLTEKVRLKGTENAAPLQVSEQFFKIGV